MKKTYNQPECIMVLLGTCKMMAESLPLGDEEINDSDQILTKEDKTVGKNIWDEEW